MRRIIRYKLSNLEVSSPYEGKAVPIKVKQCENTTCGMFVVSISLGWMKCDLTSDEANLYQGFKPCIHKYTVFGVYTYMYTCSYIYIYILSRVISYFLCFSTSDDFL